MLNLLVFAHLSLEINTTYQHCRHNVQHKNMTDLTLAGNASMPNFSIYFSFSKRMFVKQQCPPKFLPRPTKKCRTRKQRPVTAGQVQGSASASASNHQHQENADDYCVAPVWAWLSFTAVHCVICLDSHFTQMRCQGGLWSLEKCKS